MDCHQSTNGLRHRLINGLLSIAFSGLLFTCGALPANAQTPKLQRLNDVYKNDARLMVVSSKGSQTKRCVAAGVGHFAILTSYECLASWWTQTKDYVVSYASDPKREYFFGRFERAHRAPNTASRWAVLETAGHSSGYFGYEDLDQVSDLSRRTFDFIGFSKKVKGARELAIQSPCRLSRTRAGLYTSDCGGDFDATGILILHAKSDSRYVSGLATAQSQTKTGKQLVVTLGVTSRSDYGVRLTDLRRDQDARYQTIVAQRNAAAAEYQAASANDWEAQAERERRAARRQADLDKFTAAMGALGAALGGARQPVVPQMPSYSDPPPTRPAPSPSPVAPVRQPSTGPTRWECGVQTTCAGNARVELPPNGTAQLRLVDSESNVLAYMNFYWSAIEPPNSIKLRRLTITVGIGSTSRCQLTSDAGFYINGRIETFLGGVGTGPEIASMEYRTVKRQFYIPEGATLTIGPGAAHCTGVR